jgi:hypothetical protein
MEFVLALLNPDFDGDLKQLLQCEAGDKEEFIVVLREAAAKLEFPEVDGKDLLEQMNDRASIARSPAASRSSSELSTTTSLNTPKHPTLSGRNLNGSTLLSASSDSFIRSPPAAAPPQSPIRAGPVVDPVESRTYVLLAYDRKEETKLYGVVVNMNFCVGKF